MANGVAGRTDYSSWDKRAKELSRQVEELDNEETNVNAKALGLDGKYALSSAEANERDKAKELKKKRTALEGFKKREDGAAEVLDGLLGPVTDEAVAVEKNVGNNGRVVKHITRELLSAGKRVLRISDTTGPGKIILTSDLSNLESEMPSNGLQTKSYKDDAESHPEVIVEGGVLPQDKAVVRGLIKLVLCNLHSCTVIIRCKIITGTVEISHCTNLTVIVDGDDATVITIQADLCTDLDIQFHDSPSGKNTPQPQLNQATTVYWGQDTEDRIYHAGISKLHISTYRDKFLEYETPYLDYIELGATAIGNSKPEEVQFVTSIVNGEFITERILSITEKIQAGGSGSAGGNGAKPMTERDLRNLEEKRGKIHTALDGYMKDVIRITDKDGNEVIAPSKSDNDRPITATNEESNNNNNDDEVVEEVYASKTREEIHAIIECSNCEKTKGNESFMAGEYAQAILFYTLALERAAELPDATDITEMLSDTGVVGSTKSSLSSKVSVVEQLFPRHVVLSNRSACFLKLGHHDKALKDGRDAEILDPSYVKGIFRKGLALHAMGRYDEAIASLAAALKIEPKNKQIKQALGFAEMRMTQEMRKRMQG